MMVAKPMIFVVVSVLAYYYISTLFENDRFFSHLSNLEREMTFRTEAGFYYSYYKTIVEAPTFLEGWRLLVNDTGTEYPSHINTLQRFNVYPEVVLGGAFRVFRSVVTSLDMTRYFRQCYGISRAEGMEQVESCIGAGELSVFYVNGIFGLAGLQLGILFLIGCHLAGNVLGGLLAVSNYFFNFGECTRVQWIPPLRESFSLPFLMLLTLLLSDMLKTGHTTAKKVFLTVATILFTLPWQFTQFVLFTQTLSLFGSYSLSFLNKDQLTPVLDCVFIGYTIATVFQFLNTMLISSIYVSSYLAFKVVLLLNSKSKLSNTILQFARDVTIFLVVAGIYKVGSASLLQLSDDAHIFNILKAKFTTFRDFHTLLYICSKAFDFIEMETFYKFVLTLLLPTTLAVLVRLTYVFGKDLISRPIFVRSEDEEMETPQQNESSDLKEGKDDKRKPAAKPKEVAFETETVDTSHNFLTFHMFQFVCFLGMAVILMRLKLFMTPYMCILSSLAANNFVLPQSEKSRYVIVFLLLGAMSVTGYSNINHTLEIQGEFNNPTQEELFLWIRRRTKPDAVFAGPMPLTANLRLSTGRNIVNHPHYEDSGMRDRTKLVYQIFSRKPGEEVYESLKSLSVQYAVLDKNWCITNRPTKGCALPEIFDYEDLENVGKRTFCEEAHKYGHLFELVFTNSQYRVLKLK